MAKRKGYAVTAINLSGIGLSQGQKVFNQVTPWAGFIGSDFRIGDRARALPTEAWTLGSPGGTYWLEGPITAIADDGSITINADLVSPPPGGPGSYGEWLLVLAHSR